MDNDKVNNKKSALAWAFYDWGNSAFATTVMAGFFPVFFKTFWSAGVSVNRSTAFLGFANSIASLIVAILAPALGAIADQSGGRKKFLAFFAFLGAIMTACLFAVNYGNWMTAAFIYVIGIIGFSGGNIFYDSLLLDVSNEKNVDYISSQGFALGYLGGGILFLINVLWFLKPGFFGFPVEGQTKIDQALQPNSAIIQLQDARDFSIPEDKKIGKAIITSQYKSGIEIISMDTTQLNKALLEINVPADFNRKIIGKQVAFGKYKKADINEFKERSRIKLKNLTRPITESDSIAFTLKDTITFTGITDSKLQGVKGLERHYRDISIKTDFLNPEKEYLSIRVSFLSVGLWWAIFTLPLLLLVKEKRDKPALKGGYIVRGFKQLYNTFKKIRHMKVVFLFLLAYWLYIDGVNTVIRMAVDYGISIGLTSTSLIVALLITQFVGFPSALLMGKLGEKWDVKKAIYVGIFIYISVTIWAVRMSTDTEFYILAAVVGLAQGGIQALSRSYYSRLIPARQSAEFYGFFNMLGKFAAILGPALIGGVNMLAMSMGYGSNFASRIGIASVGIFFVLGWIVLYFVDEEKGKAEATYLEQ